MRETLKDLMAKRISELLVEDERLCQSIADKEDKEARLVAELVKKQAELDRVTAQLKERRQEHRDVEASFQSMRKETDKMLRILNDPPRSFLEGMGRQA